MTMIDWAISSGVEVGVIWVRVPVVGRDQPRIVGRGYKDLGRSTHFVEGIQTALETLVEIDDVKGIGAVVGCGQSSAWPTSTVLI